MMSSWRWRFNIIIMLAVGKTQLECWIHKSWIWTTWKSC